jgi:hypothetical protein
MWPTSTWCGQLSRCQPLHAPFPPPNCSPHQHVHMWCACLPAQPASHATCLIQPHHPPTPFPPPSPPVSTSTQAVAAMAWGTASCPKVDKIAGPGNQYVTAAKMLLQNSEAMVGIDMPAGPSEVLVIADAAASPVHVAADLLSQAEHGPDSQVVLLALPGVDLNAVEAEVQKQCDALPRNETARKALTHSVIVQVGPWAHAGD